MANIKKKPGGLRSNRKRGGLKPTLLFGIIALAVIFYFAEKLLNQQKGKKRNHKTDYREEIQEAESPLLITGDSIHYELPATKPGDVIVKHFAYTLRYSEENEEAIWVAYSLSSDNVFKTENKKREHRTNDFREDPAIPTGSAIPEDYKKSGYDRGHLCPAGDMTWSKKAMSESFLMSNMTPQLHAFNAGIWNDLEDEVRHFAQRFSRIYIVTGPVLQGKMKKIGVDGVSVPKYFYKVILTTKPGEEKAIGFVMENRNMDGPVYKYAVPVDSVERLTGLDFFPSLPDALENRLEKSVSAQKWQ